MFDLAFVAVVLVVCHLGRTTGRGNEAIQRVDRFELNHYLWADGCQSHQVILWRWNQLASQYEAERYFFVAADGSQDPFPLSGKRWRFIQRDVWGRRPDRVFEADDLLETFTDYDPWKAATSAKAIGH